MKPLALLLLFPSLILSGTFRVLFTPVLSDVLEVLRRAERFVYISSYSLDHPKVLETLEDLSRSGVDVRVVSERPVAGEIPVRLDADPRSLNHAKFIVVDGEIVIVGSGNLSLDGLEGDENDFLVFHDRSVASFFSDLFLSIWNGLDIPGSFENEMGIFFVGPKTDLEDVVLDEISKAGRSVDICAFAFTDPNILALLKYLSSEGVRIRMLLDDWNVSNDSVLNFPLPQFEVLVRDDVHHKFVIIDGKILITGSANFTESAYHRNLEVLFVSDEEDLVRDYEEHFEDLWGDGDGLRVRR